MKRTLVSAFALVALLLSAALLSRMTAKDDSDGQSRIQRGFDIAPVPLNLVGKNRALVGLGSYIVNAQGGCNDCHTCPSYNPANNPYHGDAGEVNIAGYLAGGVPFGPFTSRNITPDPNEDNLPAGLTFEQFKEVLHTGIDLDKLHPNISPLLQVMPWPVYRHMTNNDMRAVYEYLKAIPHANTPPPGTCTQAGE